MFFAQLFVGYIIGSPLLQWWGVRKGNANMQRLAGSLDRFNIYTFSVGATFAGMFLILIFGLYPRVTGPVHPLFLVLPHYRDGGDGDDALSSIHLPLQDAAPEHRGGARRRVLYSGVAGYLYRGRHVHGHGQRGRCVSPPERGPVDFQQPRTGSGGHPQPNVLADEPAPDLR